MFSFNRFRIIKMRYIPIGLFALILVVTAPWAFSQESKSSNINTFGDPFVQATQALTSCPVPAPTTYTDAEFRALNHDRTQRGNSCYLSGRCRLANAYLYDAEIIPRAVIRIQRDGRFDDTSIWLEGQRRWVTLKGCVTTAEQAKDIEIAVRNIDDVESVVNQLMVGTRGKPVYKLNN
jgi:BON domain